MCEKLYLQQTEDGKIVYKTPFGGRSHNQKLTLEFHYALTRDGYEQTYGEPLPKKIEISSSLAFELNRRYEAPRRKCCGNCDQPIRLVSLDKKLVAIELSGKLKGST